MQLCEYENQNLEAFVVRRLLYAKLFSGPREFVSFSYCAWLWKWLIASEYILKGPYYENNNNKGKDQNV